MSASGPGWLWSRLRAREAFNRRTDNVNLNNHREAPGTHSHRGWTHSLSPGCAHLSSGFWMDVTPSPSLLSVSLSHSLPDRRVCPELLLSVEQCPYLWSPCMLGGQSPGTGSSAPSSGSASTSGSSFITGNTSQDLPLFPATNCTSQMMLWCGGRGSISLGEPSTPLCSPWHFYNPSSGSWVGWQPQPSPLTTCWFMVDTSPPPELPGATATVPHEGLLWWHAPAKPTPPGILFLYFFKESKIFQLQCGDAV